MIVLQNDQLACCFDEERGTLAEIRRGGVTIPFTGIDFDFGCDEAQVTGILAYESMLDFRTWVLPDIRPTGTPFSLRPARISHSKTRFIAAFPFSKGELTLSYSLSGDRLELSATLRNKSDAPLYLNSFSLRTGLPLTRGVVFDFPGNAPIYRYEAAGLKEREVIQSGLINFATRIQLPAGDLDLVFIDPIEKWGCGAYRDGDASYFVYDAGLEADLAPGKALSIGTLYLLPCAPASPTFSGDGNPYLKIRQLVQELGFAPTPGGITDGVLYSGHPSGTMDSRFPLKDDLYQYAEQLPALRAMGIDHVWILPVFEHDENGVYHSTDQAVIDPRYGGEEGCQYFCDKAHELGMTVLFDYVPHGPAPEFPLVKAHPDWPSKRRDGSLQDEWECVSMDYNHPGYQEYTAALVADHVRRFGVDGARIDCAMGGLSNWRPYPGNRPSGNSVLAGVHITEAIRNGFLRGGKPSLILPENFNLIPNYYHCTDLFYGMNLYRAFVELQDLLRDDPTRFVYLLSDYLEREALITPPELHKMRFLGNHDTVSWVWQAKRAVDCYGVAPAKALFALISLIDGVPMIYQGDEDPTVYGGHSENLTAFFTRLFADRKKWIPRGSNQTTYLHSAGPVMAFRRDAVTMPEATSPDGAPLPTAPYQTEGSSGVLVLINFSPEPAALLSPFTLGRLVSDSAGAADPQSPLAPYAYRILRLNE